MLSELEIGGMVSAREFHVLYEKFDAVIVGAGGSGMRASLQLAEAGYKVAVLSKVFPTRSHTVAAQGGVGASPSLRGRGGLVAPVLLRLGC